MSSTTGRIPTTRLTAPVETEAGRAAYTSNALHPRVSPTGRYAMPERRYVWRDPARFQKPVTPNKGRGKVA